ncbi:MAG: HEAT repeat domain-containing protein [Verrucomicrobia bacterium]|nr:HEAT repeat domain-containing protein [Verrucomicrobiota bacterium]
MQKAIYSVLLLLLGIVSVGVAHRIPPAREPVYQDKPLTTWLEDLNSTALYTQDSAKAAIREMGTNAVPSLTEMLNAHDSRFKLLLMKLAAKQSLIRVRFRTKDESHLMAIKGFRAIGPLARPAIPPLIGFLNNAETANEAAYSLVVIDESIFPLTRATTNQNYEVAVRSAAIARLASGQYDEQAVLAVLLKAFEDKNPEISSQAARSLGLLKKEPRLVVPSLIEKLSNANANVRQESAWALGRFGAEAATAIPSLLRTSEDQDRQVRNEAINALKKIGSSATAKAVGG